MDRFFEFEIETIAEFFGEANEDLLSIITGDKPYLDATKYLVYFKKLALKNHLISCGQGPLYERTMTELRRRGLQYVTLYVAPSPLYPTAKSPVPTFFIAQTEVPPLNDWGAIRVIEEIHEETHGIRVGIYVNDPAQRKLDRLQKIYAPGGGKIDPVAIEGKYRRFVPTDKDYASIRTTKVLIMSRELTSEPAPPPRGNPSDKALGRVPDYEAYAHVLLDRNVCEPGESVIYPINVGFPLVNQQVLLRAAVQRINPTVKLKTERYGDRYLRLRLEGWKK